MFQIIVYENKWLSVSTIVWTIVGKIFIQRQKAEELISGYSEDSLKNYDVVTNRAPILTSLETRHCNLQKNFVKRTLTFPQYRRPVGGPLGRTPPTTRKDFTKHPESSTLWWVRIAVFSITPHKEEAKRTIPKVPPYGGWVSQSFLYI